MKKSDLRSASKLEAIRMMRGGDEIAKMIDEVRNDVTIEPGSWTNQWGKFEQGSNQKSEGLMV